jgi:transposase
MNVYHLSSAAISGLKLLHKTLKQKREADRVKAVYMLGAGYAVSDVAFILDLREETVHLSFQRYRELGQDHFYQLNYTGRESSSDRTTRRTTCSLSRRPSLSKQRRSRRLLQVKVGEGMVEET